MPLIEGEAYWALDVWNGRQKGEEANLGFWLFEPPTQLDGIVIEVQIERLRAVALWADVLAATRQLSEMLGGCAIVSSHELQEEVARKIAGAEHAAYAAFWGVDRSGLNPLYRWLATTGREAPTEIVACDSWEEVNSPDRTRLRAITESLADVAAAAGEGIRT